MPPPSPSQVAQDVARAMVAIEPPDALAWATARDANGKPLYMVAVVMGSQNCTDFDAALERLRPHMKPVDTFVGTAGDPLIEAGS